MVTGPSTHIQIQVETMENECFVIMPFDGLFKREYEFVIQPAIEAAGLKPVRGDEIFSKPQIMADVWRAIRRCRVVFAELSGRNPNVFYELGLAHAIGKPSIIVTRNETDVPFDLKALRYVFYDVNDPSWGETLKHSISDLLKKLLSASESGSGLEGIETSGGVEVATRPTPREPTARHPTCDVTGVWTGELQSKTSGPPVDVVQQAVANLQQHGSQVSGGITLTSHFERDTTVVYETVVGTIDENTLSLQGVSYSFIRQGKADTYDLDSFELQAVQPDLLKGVVHPGRERPPSQVTLKKL
ncbi:MAG TPA: hypothetical protein VK548_18575 [Candidatus Acidoferrum sp.]|nr:hypothetical protein [Candidatus Acidoferrum sp.]